MAAKPQRQSTGQWLMRWLGRQVGHVKQAAATPATPPPAAAPEPSPSVGPAAVVYRKDDVREADVPGRPGLRLRRTTIDEVIVEPPAASDAARE